MFYLRVKSFQLCREKSDPTFVIIIPCHCLIAYFKTVFRDSILQKFREEHVRKYWSRNMS